MMERGVKRETIRHPKTYDLAARLSCSRANALGYLTLLWDFTGEQAPQGDVGKWGDGAIARACDFEGDAELFVKALVDAKWVDRSDKHRLVIHDWPDHCEDWVRKKLARMKQRFLDCYGVDEGSSVHKKRGNRPESPEVTPAAENHATTTVTTPAERQKDTNSQQPSSGGETIYIDQTPAERGKPQAEHKPAPRGVPPECENAKKTPGGAPPESLSKPNRTNPIQTEPNRTEPERAGPGREDSRSGREDFFVLAEDDWPSVEPEFTRLKKAIGKTSVDKWRMDVHLCFQVAVLKHFGQISEAIIADTCGVLNDDKNQNKNLIANRAGFLKSGLILRCGHAGIAFHTLLAKTLVPDWAEAKFVNPFERKAALPSQANATQTAGVSA
jgi:hypothetical protein